MAMNMSTQKNELVGTYAIILELLQNAIFHLFFRIHSILHAIAISRAGRSSRSHRVRSIQSAAVIVRLGRMSISMRLASLWLHQNKKTTYVFTIKQPQYIYASPSAWTPNNHMRMFVRESVCVCGWHLLLYCVWVYEAWIFVYTVRGAKPVAGRKHTQTLTK